MSSARVFQVSLRFHKKASGVLRLVPVVKVSNPQGAHVHATVHSGIPELLRLRFGAVSSLTRGLRIGPWFGFLAAWFEGVLVWWVVGSACEHLSGFSDSSTAKHRNLQKKVHTTLILWFPCGSSVRILVMCAVSHARWRFVIMTRDVTMAQEVGQTWPHVFAPTTHSDSVRVPDQTVD